MFDYVNKYTVTGGVLIAMLLTFWFQVYVLGNMVNINCNQFSGCYIAVSVPDSTGTKFLEVLSSYAQ